MSARPAERRFIGARLRDTPSRQVTGAAIGIAAAILLLFAYAQWQSYHDAVARYERATRNVALLLAEHAARTFDGIEETLRAVGRLRSDVARGVYRSQASIYTHLKTLRGGSSILSEVGWFDHYGERVATSQQIDPPRVSIAQQELFLVPRDGETPNVHVSVPLRSPSDGAWQIPVSLRLETLDGSFAGVASGTIDPEGFAKIYRSLDLGPGLSTTLFRGDGIVLAHAPDATAMLGRSVGEAPFFRLHASHAVSGTYHAPNPFDGTAQITSYVRARSAGDGLVVVVGVSRQHALAEFWRTLMLQAAAAGLALVVLLVGARLLVLGLRRRERLQTELAEATATANAARIEAETANRVKSEFLANVSHELRTPLTLILAPLDQLVGQKQVPPDWRIQIERVQRNGLLLLNRVNDILDYSRVEAGKFDVRWEAIDLTELIPTLAGDASAAAEVKEVSLSCQVDPTLDAVHLDRRHFEKIVLNFVGNALKFTPRDGWIRLEARSLDDTWFEFAVVDSGIGIPADKLPLLFQRFQQVDTSATRQHGGTGIGLALVKELSELMGGTAGVESEPNHGSRFFVRLRRRADRVEVSTQPSVDGAAGPDATAAALRRARFQEATPTAPMPTFAAAGNGAPAPAALAVRVLVVDDNPDMHNYVADLLRDECDVFTASDGLEAWAMVQRQPVDVIVSDVMMPRLDGLGLAARIKANPALSHIPVLLLTARGGSEASVSGLESGADDYIAKPFTPAELKARVRSALRMSQTQAQLRQKSREAGMSMVAVGILHNLGNLLNGVTVSAGLIEEKMRHSRIGNLRKAVELFEAHRDDLSRFLGSDEKGQKLPAYIKRLSEQLLTEQDTMLKELSALKGRTAHAVGMIATQQRFTKRVALEELVPVDDMMETALQLSEAKFEEHGVKVECDYASSIAIVVDRYKVLQILLNLVENACHALRELPDSMKELRVRTWAAGDRAWVQVVDNGAGIKSEHLPLLFNQGFTTKEDGHGQGLHSSANWARELGGTLRCESGGPGKGASFTLELPAVSLDKEDSPVRSPALVTG